ncbi:cytochrome b561 [Chitinivorax tropicus]|uniref:Cytochrome b561 n=1 Tax=Chitinivorax tropicus TaxID=714531 RepID=A0A840MKQ8_9PROT|nr:cytochrome b [Chitinivorax tropicus]MBB5019000.1 cytochrome b561 [Chitinivorax tropicus]
MKTPDRYDGLQVSLHWLIAIMIIGAWVVGNVIESMSLSPAKLQLISYHKWAGMTIFGLAIIRLAYRLVKGAPALPAHMPAWQRMAANGAHHLLYLLMLAIPLSGWLMSSAKGFPVVYLGLFTMPELVGKDAELGELFEETHEWLNNGLALILLAHVGAALKHHYIDRDDILTRMVPWLRNKA